MMQSKFTFVKYMREGATKTMNKVSLAFCLGPLLTILSVFRGLSCVNAFVQFHELTVLEGYVCPEEYVDIITQLSSTTKCLLQCVATPSCRGVSYEEDTLNCIKCSTGEFLERGINASGILYKRHGEKNENEARFGIFTYTLVLEALDWDDAKVNCENMGGFLASIESSDEQTYLMNLVQSNHSFGVWIGGRGSADDINSFQWTDGTFVSAGYSNWYKSKVTDLVGLDCMKMSQNTNYQWKNKACTETSPSVCKFG